MTLRGLRDRLVGGDALSPTQPLLSGRQAKWRMSLDVQVCERDVVLVPGAGHLLAGEPGRCEPDEAGKVHVPVTPTALLSWPPGRVRTRWSVRVEPSIWRAAFAAMRGSSMASVAGKDLGKLGGRTRRLGSAELPVFSHSVRH